MNSILSATVLIPLIVIVLLIVLLCVGYVKAPPDMAYIISGVKTARSLPTWSRENAEPDLAAMGLDIISFNVQNFVDGNEVIENLGIDNIVKIKRVRRLPVPRVRETSR